MLRKKSAGFLKIRYTRMADVSVLFLTKIRFVLNNQEGASGLP